MIYENNTIIQIKAGNDRQIECRIGKRNTTKTEVIERGIFIGLQTGGSQEHLMFGVEVTYLNRKSNYYGIGASRFGEFNIYEFKFGTRFLHW